MEQFFRVNKLKSRSLVNNIQAGPSNLPRVREVHQLSRNPIYNNLAGNHVSSPGRQDVSFLANNFNSNWNVRD